MEMGQTQTKLGWGILVSMDYGSEGPVPMLYDDDPSVPPFIPKQRPIAFHLYQNLVCTPYS